MNRHSCCVPGCEGGGQLHLFPNPKTRNDMFSLWVMKIRGEIINNGYDDLYIYRNRRVCQKHFEPQFVYGNRKLTPTAVPMKYLTGLHSKDDETPELSPSSYAATEPTTSSSSLALPIQHVATVGKMAEVRLEEVRRFMEDSLKAVGAPETEAKAQADLLMHADTVGHYSHGLNRLEFYINDCISEACAPTAKPVILKESAATAWVDGGNALGATVGNFCMDIAIKKAKESGVGWVTAKQSNHYGMAGYWALKAEREGLIGMSFTNSSPIMVPTRSKERALGTNPIAMAAPAANGDNIVVDMATTAVAMGKIEVQIHKEEPLPEGWALGPDGEPTTDAKQAFKAGCLMPLGGVEKTSGYKGYALSAMVEVFCSGLSGSNSTHQVRSWELTSDQGPANLGQCFAAIDPGCFAPGFAERIADCLQHYRNLEPVDPSLPVIAPGDKERITGQTTTARGTVSYPIRQIDAMQAMAKRIGVNPIQVL